MPEDIVTTLPDVAGLPWSDLLGDDALTMALRARRNGADEAVSLFANFAPPDDHTTPDA